MATSELTTNQSANHLNSQSTNQSANQSANQSTNQPTNLSTSLSIKSASQPTNQAANGTASYHQPDMIDVSDAGAEATLFVQAAPHQVISWDASKTEDLPSHTYLQDQLRSGFSVATFEFNDPSSLTAYFITSAISKSHSAIWKRFVGGLLAGTFVSFGSLFAISAAGGLDPELREAYPAIPKCIMAITFPIAITMILLVGGDLFTGNFMQAGIALFTGRIGLGEFTNILVVSFFSNLCGVLFWDYFLGYLSDLYTVEPWNTFVLGTANSKVALDFGVVVLRGIGANTMICVALFMGSASRDALGRFIISWAPVSLFCAVGFEHVIANMAFIPLALMYGGTTFTTSDYILRSMIPSCIGNMIGGTFVVGGFMSYLYAKRRQDTFIEWLEYICVPDVSMNEWFSELWRQLLNDRPIKEDLHHK